MTEIFKNKYRIDSSRLKNWDYGSQGLYFVTICTKDRGNYFGEIEEHLQETQYAAETQNIAETQNVASLRRTEIGNVAHNNWLDIPKHFQFVELDEFVVMPNHIHGVIFINKPDKEKWEPNRFGPQSQNLASIIRGYKAAVKAYATINNIEFSWQPRYHDRVIRNQKEYLNIREYIFNNPQQWLINGDKDDLF